MPDEVYHVTVTRVATFQVRAGSKASATRQIKRAIEEGIVDFDVDAEETVETKRWNE